MAGIPLINTTANQMIHLFMLQLLFFIQLVIQSISRLIGKRVGKNLHFKKSKGFGKSIGKKLHFI
jgi:hypothetical protein